MIFKKLLVMIVFLTVWGSLAGNPAEAVVAVRIDDGALVSYQNAFPALQKSGIKATWGIITGRTGKDSYYANWMQVGELKANGQCIWSHSVDHISLFGLSRTKLQYELQTSLNTLKSHGITPLGFIYPMGDVNATILSWTAKYYKGGSNVGWEGDPLFNDLPIPNKYLIIGRGIYSTVSLDELRTLTLQSEAAGELFVPIFHEIVPGTPTDQYSWNVNDFQAYLDWLVASGIKTVTLDEALALPGSGGGGGGTGTNLIQNSGFETLDASGWAANWERKDTVYVLLENSPSGATGFFSGKRLKLVGNLNEVAATAASIKLSPGATYQLTFSVETQLLSGSGNRMGIWVDELDSGGNYLGGQELGGIYGATVSRNTYPYKAKNVNTAEIQINFYTEARAQGMVYVDNVIFTAN
ncbi:MAG TPA: polysaccharide deacetylase family protein [Candidatus Bathyarchaeia archaeon]|nr:polysaccharide deacetylase family protein [Candidatus Bathyarchaeia archaeon]